MGLRYILLCIKQIRISNRDIQLLWAHWQVGLDTGTVGCEPVVYAVAVGPLKGGIGFACNQLCSPGILQACWWPGMDSHAAVYAAQVGMAQVPACWKVGLGPCTPVCSAVGGYRAASGLPEDRLEGGFQSACQGSCYSSRMSSPKWLLPSTFIAALFTIAQTWKQPYCPTTAEWVKKMWCIYIYTMEYYSAIKMNGTLSVTALMDLKGIMLSEISQKAKEKYCMISLIS